MNDVSTTKESTEAAGSAQHDTGSGQKYDFDLILDIPLEVHAVLGQTRMLVDDLLQLGQGSILELDKKVGEQLDIYIGDKLIARGEAVVVEEKFGIRLTDIVSPAERVKTLG